MIPFEPRNANLVEARAQARSVLAALAAQPGELLHGVIEGAEAVATDLDNALLYNIGGRVAAATRDGVLLERREAEIDVSVRYRYRLVRDDEPGALRGWSALVQVSRVALARRPESWLDVWAAVRPAPEVAVLAWGPTRELCLDLKIGAPGHAGGANGQFVKALVDGVITALHAHADRGTIDEISRRLEPRIGLSAVEIRALFLDDVRAVLGSRQHLLVLRGRGVQCQPDDVRIRALRIEIDRFAQWWSIKGRLAGR